ncbi:ATP-binding cassette domain-containing protein [Streptomyces tubbatahanensis]|uniref:ATP-binding cassette domain-containing protein n=1 Tax=Streptomyces tubbatahanensis TaxID=2923272 RepID=A0ABY3XQ20_9ACTN|nr:ATP-binding cassette domain-containing protein [Streptomyces tubbatahanensis]UNS96474.1 ATP-binding cassette domain-containing protein [Streptomyces tubbatahanensis]
MSVWRNLRQAYERAHAAPGDLCPEEAAQAGLDVRDRIADLAAHVEARGLWLGLLRHFWRHATGYLLLGIGVVVTGALVPRAIDHVLSRVNDGGPALRPAVALSVVATAFTLLRWASTWQVRMLVYRIDLSVQRLIFRRLQRTDPRWLGRQKKSSTTFLLEYPQQLSQSAFAAEFVVHSALIVTYVVCVLVWFGAVGFGVAAVAGLGALVGRTLVDRMTATTKEYLTGDHRRAELIDGLVAAWQAVRRQHLEPVVTAAFASVREEQRGTLLRRARSNAWVDALRQALPQVVVWAAVLAGVMFSTGLAAGEGVALLVLVRMLVSAVDENIATYVNIRFAWVIGREVTALLSEAPEEADPVPGSAPAPGTVTISPTGPGRGGGVTVAPGERVVVLGRDQGRTTRLMEQIAGMPTSCPEWRVAHGGELVLVARGQPVFDGPIAETVALWRRPVEQARYRQALVRSGLLDDLAARPEGDGAELSASTERLSDGQTVRVSLAQALYLAPDVLLLDDVFAPLDPQCAAQVAAGVMADDPGLGTRMCTTTRPEITRCADRFLIVADGEIVSFRPEELSARSTTVRKLLGPVRTAELLAAVGPDGEGGFLPGQRLPVPEQRLSALQSAGLRYGFPEGYVPPHASAFDTPTPVLRISDFYRNVRGMFSPSAIGAVLVCICALVAVEYGLAYLVDHGITDFSGLWWLSALVAVGVVVAWLRSWLPLRTPIGAIDRVHTGLVRGLLSGRLDERSASVTGRLSRDFFTLELRVPFQLAECAAAWISMLAAAAAVLAGGWWTVLPLGLIALLGVGAYRRGRSALIASSHLSAACRNPLLNFARAALGTPGFHTSPALRRALSARFDDLGAVRAVGILRRSWVQLRTLLMVEILGLGVFLIALWAVVLSFGATALAAGVVVYAAYTLAQRAALIVEGMLEFDGTLLAIRRVAELLGSSDLPTRARLLRETPRDPACLTDGFLRYEDETRPGGGPPVHAQRLQPLMPEGLPRPEPLDLVAEPGSLTVLTGPSGVGKSTLLKTLAGANAAANGTVLLNGAKPAVLSSRTRSALRYADADIPRLPVTVRAFLRGCPDGLVLLAQLCAATGTSVPEPEDTFRNLSHTHRQLVNLARVFADGPSAVFLDEATSAMDAQAEHAALDTVRRAAPHTAIIAVLHRTANQDLADRRITVSAARQEPVG